MINLGSTMTTALSLLAVCAAGCATKSDYVMPEDARKLTAREIASAFSNARERYEAVDDPGLTAVAFYVSDGGFTAYWEKGWFFDGSVEGNWYTEDDRLCVKTTTKIDGSDLYCVDVYEKDGVYTTVHPDGRYQGIATLTPMGEVMSSERLREVFVGNTVHGSFPDGDETFEHWEYFDEDGTIYGRTAKDGDFKAKWEIRTSGCFYSEYPNDKYDGCYYYVHDSGDVYRYHRPWSDVVGREAVLEGNPERLGGEQS